MKYPGQKGIDGARHKIINEIPPFDYYYELFAGTGEIGKELYQLNNHGFFHFNDLDISIAMVNIKRASNIGFSNLDAIDIIKSFSSRPPGRRFSFLDPPYLHSTRPGNTKLYKYEMSLEDHVRFLEAVQVCPINIMVIHPGCDLYNHYLSSWRKVPVQIRYNRKTSQEYLYMNYSKPGKLHTDKLLGTGWIDRQRIKRKGERHIQKFQSLPIQERNYILSRLYKLFPPAG